MGFFGIGTWELLLILVLALIIWGPGRLPEIARTLGKITRTLKKASFDLTTALTKEIEIESEDKNTPPSPPARSTSDQAKPTSSAAGKKRARQQDNPPESPEKQ